MAVLQRLRNRFSAGSSESGHRRYQAEVVPWLWFLTRTSDCRIFAEKKIPDILDLVFKDCPFEHNVEWKASRAITQCGRTASSTAKPTSTSSPG